MSTKYVAILMILLIGGSLLPAHAAQLDVVIPKNSKEINPTFQITRVITVEYENEKNKLAELVGNTKHSVIFDITPDNSSVLIDKLNSDFEKKSFVRVAEINGKYSAIIIPQKNSFSIEYKITLHPTLQGHFIGESTETLDSNWRGFNISEKIPIETAEYGIYDINSPKSILAVTLPRALELVSQGEITEILDLHLINSSGISDLPLSKWESMFDPTAKMSETAEYGFTGNIITNYSMGICTVYLGVCQDKDYQKEFAVENERYHIRSIESQDDATIIIEGYVEEDQLGTNEVFAISDKAPSRGNENDTQVTAMYAISGMGVAIAAGFFVWSNKKTKSTATGQTGIDPKDLYAVAIGNSAGRYQTNRYTAELKKY